MRNGIAIVLVLGLLAGRAFAAIEAFDSAADPAYDTGWANGSNGGHGFGAWQLQSGTGQHFTGDSNANNVGIIATDINTAGRSWGARAGTVIETIEAERPFSAALSVGDRFEIDWDVRSDLTSNISLLDASGNSRWGVGTLVTQVHYSMTGVGPLSPKSVGGHPIEFTLLSSTTFSAKFDGVTYGGKLDAGGPIDRVRMSMREIGLYENGYSSYYNSMEIIPVPEPSSLAIVVLLAPWCGGRRRGRQGETDPRSLFIKPTPSSASQSAR